MKGFRYVVATAIAGLCLAVTAPRASAQVNINIGVEPSCPYGYFNYAPYNCAPFGYYGPTWFSSGIFIGAGPWFHGPEGFNGYIDRHYDPRFGYRGYLPPRGMHADWGRHRGWEHNFHGTEMREEYRHDNGHHYGQYKEHGNPHGDYHDNGHGHGNGHDNGHGNGHDH